MRLSFRKPKTPQTGKLIAIEGAHLGSVIGQVKQLAHACEFVGLPVATLHFGQTPVANEIKRKLFGTNAPTTYARALLDVCAYQAAQAELLESLAAGITVVASGYTLASLANSGAALPDPYERVKFFRWFDHLAHTVFNITKPDLTFILDSSDRYDARPIKRGAPTVSPSLGHTYQQLAKLLPATKLIASEHLGMQLTEQQVHNRIWDFTRRMVLRGTKV